MTSTGPQSDAYVNHTTISVQGIGKRGEKKAETTWIQNIHGRDAKKGWSLKEDEVNKHL